MALGPAFPPGYREAHVRQHLKPGVVIKLRQVMDDGNVHDKRFVVLHVDDRTVTCVINSVVSRFIQVRPDMLKCQVLMRVSDHDFMNHDSHVDCSRARSYKTNDVVRELTAEPERMLGSVSAELRDAMVGALKFALTISPSEAELLCKSLENSG